MPLPTAARDYLVKALQGTPVVITALVGSRDDHDPVWDKRPDPDRFTLREVLGHLADWEPIWLERLGRIAKGDHPFLPSIDEGVLAVQNNYAASSPTANLKRLSAGRKAVAAHVAAIPDDQWDLTCEREFVGELTMQQQAYYIIAHDAYHLRQIAEYVA